mgnify:CR=1 FL=1
MILILDCSSEHWMHTAHMGKRHVFRFVKGIRLHWKSRYIQYFFSLENIIFTSCEHIMFKATILYKYLYIIIIRHRQNKAIDNEKTRLEKFYHKSGQIKVCNKLFWGSLFNNRYCSSLYQNTPQSLLSKHKHEQ